MSIFNSDLKPEQIISALKDVKSSIHFVGILGSGMYPLARLLSWRGYRISGSDDNAPPTPYTDERGIRITRPRGELDRDTGLVVYSLAIDEKNADIQRAKGNALPLISRAQLLGAVMDGYKTRISVSGSHGKSTVTALIDHILSVSGVLHTAVCGARLASGESYTDGKGDIFVAEACEYKDSFLRLSPTHQLITSVELDHTDYFSSIDSIYASFTRAAENANTVILNCDDAGAEEIASRLHGKNIVTYGCNECADYRITSIQECEDTVSFTVETTRRKFNLETSLIGRFNLYNIAAAVAMTDILGVNALDIERAVLTFLPIDRRMTLISRIGDIPVYYDYAHHPSEIAAVISALKDKYGSVTVIFRPHTYSRTQSLWDSFIAELCKADFTILLDIYPAREPKVDGVDSQKLASAIENSVYAKMSEAANIAASRPSGAIALLGAGEVDDVKKKLVELGKETEQ